VRVQPFVVGMCLSVVAAAFAAAAWSAAPAKAATRNVSVEDNVYVDAVSGTSTTTVAVGDTVVWTWAGSNPHSVTSDDGLFDIPSDGFQTTGSGSYTFNQAGTFTYVCRVHGTAMSGTVIVQAAATDTPAATNTTVATSTAAPSATSTAGASATATATAAAAGTASATPPAAMTATPGAPSPTPQAATGGARTLPGAGDGAASGGGRAAAPLSAAAALSAGLGTLALVAAVRSRRSLR
jgi:plastocyanin